MNDLTVSASTAVYSDSGDLRGVLGAHITLERINNLLEEISTGENAVTVVIERNSEELIANSLEENNFEIAEDGSIQRNTLDNINNSILNTAYNNYLNSNENNFKFEFQDQEFHLSLIPFQKNGLDWLIITSIPASVFTAGIYKNIRFASFLIVLAILLSIGIYFYLTNKFLKPISELIMITDKFAAGDLSKRAEVKRNDEIALVHFNQSEKREIEEHPIIGYRILNLFDETVELADIILAHHENWDGSGYPRGLKGEEIPLMSRIIKIAENYDWKLRGKSDEEKRKAALKNIRKNAGKKYDPILVNKFFEILDDKNKLN